MKTATTTLTDAKCRALFKGAPPAKKTKYAGGGGLSLVHMPSGTLLWQFRYRVAGAEQNLSLGIYPVVGLGAAITARDEARELIAEGRDPVAVKKAEATAKLEAPATFRRFADELLAALKPGQTPATADQWERQLGYAKAHFGDRLLTDIRPRDCLEYLEGVGAAGMVSTAHGIKRKIGAVFRRGMLADACPGNPIDALKGQLLSAVVEHHPAIIEPARFGVLLRKLETRRGSPTVTNALQFLALTFQRPGMYRAARWRDIDFAERVWRIPAANMKGKLGAKREHVVPLSPQALAVLRRQEAVSGGEGCADALVFPGRIAGKPLERITFNKALKDMGFHREHVAHGFRASANTMLRERLGYAQEIIDVQLAHVIASATERAYNRAKFLDQRAAMMNAWADYLDTLRDPPANVVELPRAA